MSSKLDQSLSSIIEKSKKSSRPSRRPKPQRQRSPNPKINRNRRLPQFQYPNQVIPVPVPIPTPAPAPAPSASPKTQPQQRIVGDTVFCSNLAKDLTADDLREIFKSVGHIKSATVNYDPSGHSSGTATVVFSSTKAAEKAVKDYDRAQIDGRTLSLKLIGQVITKPVVVKKTANNANSGQQQQQQQQYIANQSNQFNPFLNQNALTPFNINPFALGKSSQDGKLKNQKQRKGIRGNIKQQTKGQSSKNPKVKKRGNKPSKSKKPVDAATLDKEMDNYHNKAVVDEVKAGQPKVGDK